MYDQFALPWSCFYRICAHRVLVVLLLVCTPAARAEVQLTGLNEELHANALAHLRLDDEGCEQPAARVRYRFEHAEQQLRAALEPFGYYRASIEGQLEFPEGECWRATFDIDPGPRVTLARANVGVSGDGAGLPALRDILAGSEVIEGAPLSHAAYDALKLRLSVTAREHGFMEARFTRSQLHVDPDAGLAEVDLVLETGPRYRFGTLSIETDTLDPDLIRRYLEFAEGQPFEQQALRRLQSDLNRGEYFSDIQITTTRRDDQTVDVLVKLTEGRRIRYGIGLGYGTDTGPVIRADWVNRWVNRRGHRLELDAELAEVLGNLSFDYRIPSRRPQRDWYSIFGGYSWRDTDAIESKTRKVGISEVRVHSRRWRSNRFLEYSIEDYRVDREWQEREHLVPGYTLTFQVSNAADRPTQGLRLSAEVLGASEHVISASTFGRLKLNGKLILPLTGHGRVLLRGESGWMATDDFNRVPPSYRFYAGGDRSVRGYAYQSLGEQDSQGNALGGERLITGSAEVDWRVSGTWSVAMFADAGNVGDDNLLADLPWSVGTGLRWYSPIGPIRLDLAFPQQGSDSFRLHISMGPDL